jgi:hypothetical protein
MRFFAEFILERSEGLRMTITVSVRFVGHFNPSKPKDITNLFAKPYPQTLRAGFEIHSTQIVCGGLSW